MSVAELKEILHEGIHNIEDESLLLVIKELIEEQYQPQVKVIITQEQEKAIDESHDDIKAGRFSADTEVNNRIDKFNCIKS